MGQMLSENYGLSLMSLQIVLGNLRDRTGFSLGNSFSRLSFNFLIPETGVQVPGHLLLVLVQGSDHMLHVLVQVPGQLLLVLPGALLPAGPVCPSSTSY